MAPATVAADDARHNSDEDEGLGWGWLAALVATVLIMRHKASLR